MRTFISLCDRVSAAQETGIRLADALRDAVKNVFGEVMPIGDLYKIQSCLVCCSILENNSAYKDYIDIIQSIRYVVGCSITNISSFCNEVYWFQVISLAKSYLQQERKNITFFDGQGYQKYVNRAESIKVLLKYGVTWRVEDNDIVANNEEGAWRELNDRISRIGGRIFIEWMLSKNIYDLESRRIAMYMPPVSCIEKVERAIPWQMLMLIAYKYLDKQAASGVDVENESRRVIVFSQHFACAMYPVQLYNQFEIITKPYKSPLDYVNRLVLIESVYTLRQSSVRSIRYVCLCLIDNIIKSHPELSQELRSFRCLMNYCMDRAQNMSFVQIRKQDLLRKCHATSMLLDSLMFAPNQINQNYSHAVDYACVNYDDKPLVGVSSGELLLAPKSIGARFWYEALTNYVRSKKLKDAEGLIGQAIEDMVKNLFRKHNIDVRCGEYEFVNDKNVKIKGQCDLLIEGPQGIYLFEIKKKGWTNKSREGKKYQEILDLSDSLLSSQRQAFKTTCALNSTDCLLLQDGDVCYGVRLNGRSIRRFSLVPKDYGIVQTNVVVPLIMENFMRYEYQIECDPNDPNKKHLEGSYRNLANYTKELNDYLLSLYGDKIDYHNAFFDSRFITLEWLDNILHDAQNIDEFEHRIMSGYYVTFSTNDIYREQGWARKLEGAS